MLEETVGDSLVLLEETVGNSLVVLEEIVGDSLVVLKETVGDSLVVLEETVQGAGVTREMEFCTMVTESSRPHSDVVEVFFCGTGSRASSITGVIVRSMQLQAPSMTIRRTSFSIIIE